MNARESADLNSVLLWAMGRDTWYGQQVTDVVATQAARRLTARARKRLGTGLRPDEVDLTRSGVSR
ncbi:MAG: hypothetical protein ACRDPY_15140 [Streptosporangiaceae bacterium]